MEYPERKPNRLNGFDYSSNGAYFITICTQNRECILANITVGDGFPVPNDYANENDCCCIITKYGKIAEKFINLITDKYNTVFVDKYVIMPNHIHILLVIQDGGIYQSGTGNPSPTIGNVIGWLKYQVTKQINELYGYAGQKIFQRSYHDHIIRSEKEFKMIGKYIDENPLRWESDCFYL